MQDVFEHAMKAEPDTGFANINSKADAMQMGFYTGIATTEHTLPLSPTPSTPNELNLILERYNDQPNDVSYLVTGHQHCYTPHDELAQTDRTGAEYCDMEQQGKVFTSAVGAAEVV